METQDKIMKRIFVLYFFDQSGQRNELIFRTAEKAQEMESFCRSKGIRAYVRLDSFAEEYDDTEWLICAMVGKQK